MIILLIVQGFRATFFYDHTVENLFCICYLGEVGCISSLAHYGRGAMACQIVTKLPILCNEKMHGHVENFNLIITIHHAISEEKLSDKNIEPFDMSDTLSMSNL